MSEVEIRETVRGMLADWDAATPEQREQAMFWAAETAEMVELLTGKYGIDAEGARDILATARREGWEEVTVVRSDCDGRMLEGWRLRIATDEGGFTIEVLDHENR